MTSRYSVSLNNTTLSSLDNSIYINDIVYGTIAKQINSNRIATHDGGFSGREYIAEQKIQILFTVRKYVTTDRQDVIQKIIGWASAGGWLKTSDRTNQRIYVKCTQYPTAGSVMRWLDTLAIEFTAFDYPYWENTNFIYKTVSNGSSDTLVRTGKLPAFGIVEITAAATLTSVSVTVGSTTIALDNISVASGAKINIDYSDEHHILQIYSGTTSLLDKRTAASDDDLIFKTGSNTISFTASGSATAKIGCKEVYL